MSGKSSAYLTIFVRMVDGDCQKKAHVAVWIAGSQLVAGDLW